MLRINNIDDSFEEQKTITIRRILNPEKNKKMNKFSGLLDRALGLHKLQYIYDLITLDNERLLFEEKFFKVTNTQYRIIPDDLSYIPKKGPLLIVANHPFGMLDGLAILAIFKKIRPDVRIMANHYLGLIPEIDEVLFGVDPFESKDAKKRNLSSLKKSIKWLRENKTLIMFPSGEVSHLHLKEKKIRDGQWSKTVGKIQALTKANVLPVFFHGKNSLLFQLSGLVNPWLRTMLLPREFAKKCHKNLEIQVRVGQPIPAIKFANLDNQQRTDFMRLCTDALKNTPSNNLQPEPQSCHSERSEESPPFVSSNNIEKNNYKAIIAPIAKSLIANEINDLPQENFLYRHKNFEIIYATANQVHHTLKEIGRLREVNFRLIGEGSGNAFDLDRYDQSYLQLLIWDTQLQSVVASCRFAPIDQIIQKHGLQGLYTHSLFDYSHQLINMISPAVEFGRLFVNLSHPRKHHGLKLLWTGLLKWLIKNPVYKYYFGVISISKDYSQLSHSLIANHCQRNRFDYEVAKYVKPRCPFQPTPIPFQYDLFNKIVNNFDQLSVLINQIDPAQKGVPTLFKKYQMFNYKVLGFNVDKEFSYVTDALSYVNLVASPIETLNKFLSPEETKLYLHHHGEKV